MPTFRQVKYCPECKKVRTAQGADQCKVCGAKLKKGNWSVRFYTYTEDGENKQVTLGGFETKSAAEFAMQKYKLDNEHPEKRKQKLRIKFCDLYQEYISKQEKVIAYGTFDTYSRYYNGFLDRQFGNKYCDEITPRQVEDWLYALLEKRYSYKYRKELKSFLSQIFNYGFRRYDITNPVLKTEPLRKPIQAPDMIIYTPEDFKRFLEPIDDPVYKNLFLLLFWTGCRIGECLALRWNDINLNAKTIYFHGTVSLQKDGRRVSVPKTQNSFRQIRMPEVLCDSLAAYQMHHNSGFVFGEAEHMSANTIRNNCNKYSRIAELPHIRLHDFRHSHVSYLLSIGASIPLVAQRIGDTQEVVMRTYSHLIRNEETYLIDLVNAKTR